MDEIEMSPFTVTCHTDGCGNAGHAIEVLAPAGEPTVICGVCGQQITDVSPLDAVS